MSSADKEALLSLVQSYEGRVWSSSLTGWSSSSGIHVCEWSGVTCRASMDGNSPTVVAELSLPSSGLSGTIPTELGLLTDLEHLSLKNNMLQGPIPQEIANLKKLITLDLTECFLTGALPQRFESTQLQTLLLANNAISGKFFETDTSPHLSSLKELRMENNLLTGTLHGSSMKTMSHLETLSLSQNDLSGLIPGEELGSLPGLNYLYLDGNHFVGLLPSTLAQVGKSQILELWLQDNALSGTVPASYVRFDRMHDFFIDGNKLTGALPPDLCGPEINSDFFSNVPPEAERNYCDSIACPAGSVAFEGVYPCERCPGGEAARLKNRYLGQTGKCSDFSQRDILKLFHESTTKAGPWSGENDWDEDGKPVCDMTGITCDAHGNIVEIMLKNRQLEGHIPDEIGFLSFLESLDVSDNELMGFIPSDLQWTSLTRLDISGNKIHGIIPPLLCMKEELNGNGADNVFYCDRIACPEGTFNKYGFHHGVDGKTCEPCYDDVTFIAQKSCVRARKPSGIFQKTSIDEMDTYSKVGLGVALGLVFFALFVFILMRCKSTNPREKYEQGDVRKNGNIAPKRNSIASKYKYDEDGDDHDDDVAKYRFEHDDNEEDNSRGYRDAEVGHSINLEVGQSINSSLGRAEYRDFVIDDEEEVNYGAEKYKNAFNADEDDDDNRSRATTGSRHSASSRRSATDLLNEHQGMALNRREKLSKAVSSRMPRGLKDAASKINVGSRQIRRRSEQLDDMKDPEGEGDLLGDVRDYDGYDDRMEQFKRDIEMAKSPATAKSPTPSTSMNSLGSSPSSTSTPTAERKKQLNRSDMLDVPMIA